MGEHIIAEINSQLINLYQQMKNILLDIESYDKKVAVDNVQLYLNFVDAAFNKEYNRISHIYAFLSEGETIDSDRMYPFCFLSEDAKMRIKSAYCQVEWLMDGLRNLRDVDSLVTEDHQ